MRIEHDAPHTGWEPIGQPVPVLAPKGAMVALYMAGPELVFEITTPDRRSVAVFMNQADGVTFQDAACRAMAAYWGVQPRPPTPPTRKGDPVTPAEKLRMVALYTSGQSVPQIARELGRSESLVYHTLDEAGIPFRRKRKRRPADW